MPETPEGAYNPSDDELDDLVESLETDDESADDGLPEDPAPTPQGRTGDKPDAKPDAADEPDNSAVREEEEEDDAQPEPAPADALPALPAGAKPFQFKASGGVHVAPFAHELPDGSVVIPKDKQTEFRQRLASEHALRIDFQRTKGEFDRRLKAAAEQRTAKDVEADAVIALFGDIKKMTPDERWKYFERFDEEAPKLELEIQRQQLALDRKALEELRNPTRSPEEVKAERTALLTTELRTTYNTVMANPSIKVLTKEEIDEVFAKHARHVDRLVSKEKDGSEVFDDQEVIDDLNRLIRIKQKAAGGTTAADRNRARNADLASNSIPPTVRGGRIPAGGNAKKEKSYKGKRKDFKKDFMKGELDED